MTAETFLQNFDLLAEAPGGVPKLRELILQLAVRGKLVPQEEGEIHHEGHEEHEGGKGKDVDGPYAIPDSWQWVAIGSVINMINGRAFKPHEWSSTGLPIVRIQNLNNPNAPYNHCDFEVPAKFHIRNGELLISWSGTPGTSFGAFIWNGGDAVLNQHIFRCELHGGFCIEFLQLAVNAQLEEMIARAHGGVGLRHITKGKLERMLITLPPLPEQKRIVAKVDELMKRCDELEARQTERNESRTALTASCLHALASPAPLEGEAAPSRITEPGSAQPRPPVTRHATRDTRNRALERVCTHFPLIIDTPESVAELRKTILQLAVQGRLVPQKKMNHEGHEEHEAEGGREKANRENAIGLQIPFGWRSVQFGALGKILGGGTPSKMRADLWCGDLPWVSPKDMKVSHLDDSADHVSTKALSESAVRLIPPRSLLVVVRGMILAHTFPAAINTVDVTINQDMKALVPHDPTVIDFLLLACRGHAERILSLVERSSHGTCKLNTDKLFGLSIGLPPLAEQKRIVAKVNELMALCDALEVKLTQSREDADTLAAAVVHHMCACCRPPGATKA